MSGRDGAQEGADGSQPNVYAQLLADAQSVAPTRSKVDDDDGDSGAAAVAAAAQPAARPASASLGFAAARARERMRSPGTDRRSAHAYAKLAVDDDDDDAARRPAQALEPSAASGGSSPHARVGSPQRLQDPRGLVGSPRRGGVLAEDMVRVPSVRSSPRKSPPKSPRDALAVGGEALRSAWGEALAELEGRGAETSRTSVPSLVGSGVDVSGERGGRSSAPSLVGSGMHERSVSGVYTSARPESPSAPTSGSATTRAYGQVVARESGAWGIAYPTADALAAPVAAPGGTGGARAQEYLVQVHSSGIGLGAGWVTRDALAQSGTDRSPRKGGTCWRGYGTARSHRGGQVELDIGDLEDVDEEAPFQSALKVTA